MKKILVLFIGVLLCTQSISAQALNRRRSYNNLFAEAWGVTGYYSVNYERILWRSPNNVFIASAAVGYSNLAHKGVRHVSWPMRVMFSVGKKRLFGEVGYDLIFDKSSADGLLHPWKRNSACNYLHVGVRYQPLHNGLYIRAYAFAIPVQEFAIPMPIREACSGIFYHLNYRETDLLNKGIKNLWWGGIGIGWSFGR